jgi:homoserine dehydrogenase
MENSNQPFRIGVAGVGAIGKNHARIMAEIREERWGCHLRRSV